MEAHKDSFGSEELFPGAEQQKMQYVIEEDSDTLEPFIDPNEHRVINADDPKEISYWAQQFQISEQDLKAAIVLNGNAVQKIKSYLSI